jgi:hypothetical protein
LGSGLGGCAGSASAAAARARGAGGSEPRARPLWEPLPCAPLSLSLSLPAGLPLRPRPARRVRRGRGAGSRLPARLRGVLGGGWGAAMDRAGRPRPRPVQPAGGVTGAGTAAVRASHLQPRARHRECRARGAGLSLRRALPGRAKGRRVAWENGIPGPAGDGRGTGRSGQGEAGKLGVGPSALWALGHASPLFVSHARRARGPTRAATGSRARPSPRRGAGVGTRWGGSPGASARPGARRGPDLEPSAWVGGVGTCFCESGIDGVTQLTQGWGGRPEVKQVCV